MEKYQIQETDEINFQVMFHEKGITVGCKDCRNKIHTKHFYIEVKINDKPFALCNSEEFRCPHCNIEKRITQLFDSGEEALDYIKFFVGESEEEGEYSLILIDLNSGIRISADGAKNAHLN